MERELSKRDAASFARHRRSFRQQRAELVELARRRSPTATARIQTLPEIQGDWDDETKAKRTCRQTTSSFSTALTTTQRARPIIPVGS